MVRDSIAIEDPVAIDPITVEDPVASAGSAAHEQGIVKWYSVAKGYGFIALEGSEAEVFVHHTGIVDPEERLAEGDRVSFELVDSPKGPRGQNVARL